MKKVLKPREREQLLGTVYAFPMGIWFTLFFTIPLGIIVLYSFLKRGLYGGVEWQFTFDAYAQMFNPSFAKVVVRTLWISIVSTLGCILIAIPCGYAMAKSKYQTFLLFLIIIPFWTNSLIRIYAWISILSTEGFVNTILIKLGILTEGVQLIYNNGAVVLVLIYMYLPFAILPLFTTIDKFDFALLDAARDLGATKLESIVKVMFPNIKSGLSTAFIFTFIPIFGAYTVPLLVGGKDSTMIGNIIVDQVSKTRNWPLASAFSMVLTFISLVGVFWMLYTGKREQQQSKKTTQQSLEQNVRKHHLPRGGK
ncbi:ABC transporter permease [Sphaerochaeta sp. PS]|uniref:ABC transporter permease n=1 Tax=Sphaerochaeta sp. PS TaxID=3076336 RepID=UPI0028A33104|nr:ABC transporter permease [Sphaerochaeta sp. PS]MDT4762797.1 ABC transporter permease [Sphaerochaeta sp. PS]